MFAMLTRQKVNISVSIPWEGGVSMGRTWDQDRVGEEMFEA